MGTKTAVAIKKTYEQYSKKMATRVTIFWMLYRIVVAILIALRPEISNSMIHLTEGADTVMIVNMGSYTMNSGTEKVAIAFGKRDARLHDEKAEAKKKQEEEDDDEESSDNG